MIANKVKQDYSDNPMRTMRNQIWEEERPQCKIEIEEIEKYFTNIFGRKRTSEEWNDVFEVGNTKCEVMCAGTGTTEENSNLNLSSIVIRMVYGEESFLFMGDAEEKNETSRQWPQTTVLKVGHHGSDTSSSESFLNQVKPEISVISVGINNTYGHPKKTTLDKLNALETSIYRTDQNGTITITCDGTNCVVTTEK